MSERIRIEHGDCLNILARMAEAAELVDAVVCDPPYHLTSIVKRFGSATAAPINNADEKAGRNGPYHRASKGFMGKTWDGGDVAFRPETWAAVFAVMKPGAHLIAFSGTRTYHRMVCAIEDAGFEIRDQLAWVYGSGFPKSHDVAKGITAKKLTGKARTTDMRRAAMGKDYQPSGRGRRNYDHGGGSAMNGAVGGVDLTEEAAAWQGWGTALKPAWEPIVLARKPLIGSVAENVLQHGTGAINIDACRVATGDDLNGGAYAEMGGRGVSPSLHAGSGMNQPGKTVGRDFVQPLGRFPANLVHDGSDEVLAAFPDTGGGHHPQARGVGGIGNDGHRGQRDLAERADSEWGSAARFFYSAKADADDRLGTKHPTVKPVDLMRWLVRMVTPPSGTVLDPFAGTGTTGAAALIEGMRAILIEREAEYVADIQRRIDFITAAAPLSESFFVAHVPEETKRGSDLPLFTEAAE